MNAAVRLGDDAVSPAEVTRVMSPGKLSESEQQFVRTGQLSKSAAYAWSRLPITKVGDCLTPKVSIILCRLVETHFQ